MLGRVNLAWLRACERRPGNVVVPGGHSTDLGSEMTKTATSTSMEPGPGLPGPKG